MRIRLILAEAFSGLRRNTSMVISVILVTAVSLTFLGAALLLQTQLSKMENFWSLRAQVSIFMCSSVSETPTCVGGAATQEQTDAVEEALDDDVFAPLIRDYTFESSDEAYANLIAQFGDQYSSFLTPDQVSSAFNVNLINHADADVIKERFTSLDGVETVDDQLQYLEPLFDSLRIASYLAAGIAALMIVAAVLLVGTTIRQSAFARRKEIGIMRLVGASNRFIQAPFVLEGVLAACFGSALATAAVWALVRFGIDGFLRPRLTYVGTWVSSADLVFVIPTIILTGVILAALSATFAIRRWLRT